MLYTPMLPEAASGTLEPRHVVVPLRMMCPHAELLQGGAVGLDEGTRAVEVETDAGSFAVTYEQLVIALGSVPRTPPGSRARRARPRFHEPRRCDPPAQPRAAPAGDGRRGAQPVSRRAPPRLRLRRRQLGGRAGDRRTLRLVRDALRYYPRLGGARQRRLLRRRLEDPFRDPHAARRVRRAATR